MGHHHLNLLNAIADDFYFELRRSRRGDPEMPNAAGALGIDQLVRLPFAELEAVCAAVRVVLAWKLNKWKVWIRDEWLFIAVCHFGSNHLRAFLGRTPRRAVLGAVPQPVHRCGCRVAGQCSSSFVAKKRKTTVMPNSCSRAFQGNGFTGTFCRPALAS